MTNQKVKHRESLMISDLEGELVVLDLLSSQIHQLNRTASFVWRMLEQNVPADAIVAAFVSEFAIDDVTGRRDVFDVLLRFRSLNLLDEA